jgi:hypothetical protein
MQTSKPKISKVDVLTDVPAVFAKTEISIETENIEGNVYDFSEVALDMELADESGTVLRLPGFYYVPYAFKPTGEIIGPTGENGSWRFRFMPTRPGKWRFTVTLTINGQAAGTACGEFSAVKSSEERGLIGIEPVHGRNFMFQNGEVYIPIGENLCWPYPVKDHEKSARYINRILRQGSPYGMNYVRLWNIYFALSIQKKGCAPNDFSKGQYDAAQFDVIFDTLAETDVYASFVFFVHGMFSRTTNPHWHDSPYNQDNPFGYLKEPGDFYTDERAKHDARCFIRYLIARYGYSRNVMVWELFNETDISEGNMDDKLVWHREMAGFVRAVDPYRHMVATSCAFADRPLCRDDVFDFTYIHWYDYPSIDDFLDFQRADWALKKRPSFYGEIGFSNFNPHIDEDLVSVHQTNWAGVMGGAAATAMTWFWNEFDSVDGYSDYAPLSAFAGDIPWTASDFGQLATGDLNVNNTQVKIIGYGGGAYAYLWLYDDNYKHQTKIITEFTEVSFTVPLKDGDYFIEWICPWSGKPVQTCAQTATGGKLEITSPAWTRDLAVKIKKQSQN